MLPCVEPKVPQWASDGMYRKVMRDGVLPQWDCGVPSCAIHKIFIVCTSSECNFLQYESENYATNDENVIVYTVQSSL